MAQTNKTAKAAAARPDKPAAKVEGEAASLTARRVKDLADWRGKVLARVRSLILAADPEMVEEVKWRKPSNPAGVPVWCHEGIVCTGEVYKNAVKLTFARGAALEDPAGLFNSSLDGNVRRAIDIRETDAIDAAALTDLIRAAVALNTGSFSRDAKRSAAGKPKLLSGGNPQIAKGDGDAPVQAYIAALPGWKREIGHRLDALIVQTVPNVRKAVRWNSPFYGVEGRGWFLGVHCMSKYVKLAFFRGALLRPLPPVESKQKDVRYLHIHDGERFDEAQLAAWVKQAAALPGEDIF